MDGKPIYYYNYFGRELTAIRSEVALHPGPVGVSVTFDYDGGGLGNGADVRLSIDGDVTARGRIEHTVPFVFSMSGETLDVGIDTCSPVGPYPHHFPFTGTIDRIEIELRTALGEADRKQFHDGQRRGALGSQ
jgi:arylsulfatase